MQEENNKENKDILENDDVQNEAENVENNQDDPMYPNNTEETKTSGEEVKPENIVENISKTLSEESVEEEKENIINPVDTFPFDPSKLTQEQLQSLKSILDATPDIKKKKSEPTIMLRKMKGKYIVDIKKAFNTPIKDLELNREVERHVIPVLFKGETKYENVLYSEFINSERVPCKVIKHLKEDKEFIEGETISRETGRPTQLLRTEIIHFFTVQLPNNEGEIDIEGKMANA